LPTIIIIIIIIIIIGNVCACDHFIFTINTFYLIVT